MIGRVLAVAAIAMAVVTLVSSPASADAPGPTDYSTEIVSVEPATDAVTVASIGGDSFIRLQVAPGHQATVAGYQGEPYLRFGPDGVVEQNENSPSRWLNDDRYGDAVIPPTAAADAEPAWVVVADDGSYSWHDHRTHWMNSVKPPGSRPGDTVLEAVVPITVDGTAGGIAVRSVLLDPPSPLPALVGAALGLLAVAAGWLSGRLGGLAVATAAANVLAVALGVAAFVAVPSETGPPATLWLLPLIGVAAAAGALVLRRWGLARELWSVLILAAAVELLLWLWTRRDALTRSFIPTDAPFALDRVALAGAGMVGAAAIVLLLVDLSRPGPGQDVQTVPPE